MAKNPIILELFWNTKLNGGKVEDVVQVIDDTEYYWNCYNCGKTYKSSIMDFLDRAGSSRFCQLNTRCGKCDVIKNLSENLLKEIVKRNRNKELESIVEREFSLSHKEQEVITVCPICGKVHSVKMRSIRRNFSFVCMECSKKYGGRSIGEYKTMYMWCDVGAIYWSRENKFSYYETVPLLFFQPFKLICPRCNKVHIKSLEGITKSGFYCMSCAKIMSRIMGIGSLRENYPEVADMWDRGNNDLSSELMLPSSTEEGIFVCTREGVPHRFKGIMYAVVESAKKGGNGCPVCKNSVVCSGVNDFATVFPDEVKNWDYSENVQSPEKSLVTNVSKFALICPRCGRGHTKRTDAIERFGSLCSMCSHSRSTVISRGSLRQLYPSVADMWDMGGNPINSNDISVGSRIEGYFYCKGEKFGGKSHKFIKSVAAMVDANKKGNLGCPVCAGFELRQGINDFKSVCPNISKLWDYEKNDKRPEDVYYREETYYNFICPEGHPYRKDLLHLVRAEERGTTGCPVCAGREVIPGVNDVETVCSDMLKYWDQSINEIKLSEVTPGSNKMIKARCRICNKVYETTVFNWCHGYVVACEDCRKRQFSVAEKELCDTIKSWGIRIEENVELTDDYRTYDMYIPDLNIAIEYNGLYFHSDAVRSDINFHRDKYMDCAAKGIELIQIWEDDYLNKRDIVLRFLRNKLGISNERKVNARDCGVYEVSIQSARDFLNVNHIQGFVSGSKYIGLREENGKLVAVMVLEKYSDTYDIQIKRYATSCNVRGGFSKLLSKVKDYFKECSGVYTFSDNTISDGKLYKENGFKVLNAIKPDYMYVVGGRRVHKFNYRKDRFRTDSNLLYAEDLSESDLARLNGLVRVYDAGKVKWFKEL